MTVRRRSSSVGQGPVRSAPRGSTTPGFLLPRHPGDVVRVALAGGILIVTARLVSRHRVSTTEADLFRLLNDLPGAAYPLIWPIMQLGNIVAVPIAAAAAALFRRYRLAAELAVTGTGVWLLAKVAKSLVPRDRPAALLPHVTLHGPAANGMGYPSGHSAVAFAMATLLTPYLGRRGQRAVWVVAVTVCLSRIYVGAHFPLDVIGGATLGWGTASAVHLLLGAPSGRPSPAGVRRGLERLGIRAVAVTPIGADSGQGARFQVRTASGDALFVKVIPNERRNRDLLYRLWGRLSGRTSSTPRSPACAADRQCTLTLLARAAGARVPEVVAAGSYGHGSGIVVQQWVEGEPLDAGSAASALREVWGNVAALRAVRLAHRDLRLDNQLVDDDGHVWLVEFADAQAPASSVELLDDVADLLSELGPLVGADVAAGSAGKALGEDVVSAALLRLESDEPPRRS